LDLLAKYLSSKMDEGILRRSDTSIAADHLVALVQAVKQAVAVFLAAYAV
jgi:hypothetical protein